jgi:uncharacterized protein (DUF4415 family)
MAKKKIRYGKKDLLAPGDLDLKNAKVMITIRLDGDVLAAIKKAADQVHVPYQTLVNQKLRETFLAQAAPISPEAIRELQAELGKLAERLEHLEEVQQVKAG